MGVSQRLRTCRKLQTQLAFKENDQRKHIAQLQSQYSAKENDYQKQIAQLRSQQAAQESSHQKQLEQVRKAAEAETEKIRRRTDAELADLKATVSRLEVDLMKVCTLILAIKIKVALADSVTNTVSKGAQCAPDITQERFRFPEGSPRGIEPAS